MGNLICVQQQSHNLTLRFAANPISIEFVTNPIIMQKYIIFSGFSPIIKKSCVYTGFMNTSPLFGRKSKKFLYICRILFETALNFEKILHFCRIILGRLLFLRLFCDNSKTSGVRLNALLALICCNKLLQYFKIRRCISKVRNDRCVL